MKPLFVLTPEAKSDLREILLDIAEDSPKTGRDPGIGHYHDELLSRR